MTKRALKVLVVGAGIGGLTAALTLQKKGCEVTVVEQANQLGEVGAGVQLSPNAIKVMRALGLEEQLRAVACEPEAFVGRDSASGRVLYRTPIKGVYERLYGAGYFHIHRADLHGALAGAVPDSLVMLGLKCVGVEQCKDGAAVFFADGSVQEADVIIGADGIHSPVRRSIFGADEPKFTGNMCWRGMVPVEALPRGHVELASTNWLGPKGHVVHYYVRGGKLVNFVAVYEADTWTEESWSTPSTVEELLQTYAGWNEELLTTFRAAEQCFKWALYDRDPLPRWTEGRVTLLGDSAHPMLPFLAQGAAMAIEDGYTIGRLLSTATSAAQIGEALQNYELARIPRTSRVQLGARSRGATMHLQSPLARLKRDLGFFVQGLRSPEATTHRAEWIYAHDVTSPDTRNSSDRSKR
jgi:salicylate hydroxylase